MPDHETQITTAVAAETTEAVGMVDVAVGMAETARDPVTAVMVDDDHPARTDIADAADRDLAIDTAGRSFVDGLWKYINIPC